MASEMPPLDYLLLPPLYSQDKKKKWEKKNLFVLFPPLIMTMFLKRYDFEMDGKFGTLLF